MNRFKPGVPWPGLTHLTALAALASAGVLLVLGGCASPGTLPNPLAQRSPASLGLAADASTAFPAGDWWQALGDPALDELITRALADQPSLQAAAARLARAEALTRQLAASQSGQVNASVDVTRQRYSAHGLVPPAVAGTVQDTANAQLTGSIELDFFGRHQAALLAALGQQRAAQADHQAARVLLASQLARGHVSLARLFSQRDLAQRTLAQRQSLLRLTTERVQAGLDSRLEQTQAEAALPEARLLIEQLDEQITLARHQLAALSGQPPDALDRLRPAIGQLRPLAPPDRLGVDLLGRRADVVAARWRVEAAAQDVAFARTQFYPDINLVGFVGLNALGLDQLLNLGSRTMGIGPALRLPVLDAGRLRAQLAGRAADADAAVAAYNGAVLQAVHEVADAGSSLQSLTASSSSRPRPCKRQRPPTTSRCSATTPAWSARCRCCWPRPQCWPNAARRST